jgi:hypothetical protein
MRLARLHQPVHLVDDGEGLAGAGGHRHQHGAAMVGQGVLDGGIGLALVGAQAQVGVGVRLEPGAGGGLVAAEQLLQGGGVWKRETARERASGSRTSWNQITSPLVAYRKGAWSPR